MPIRAVISRLIPALLIMLIQPPILLAQASGTVSDNGPDTQLKEFRIDELADSIDKWPAGADRDYFAGMIANRRNKTALSIRLLQKSLSGEPSLRRDRAILAKEALADDFQKDYRYGDAFRTQEALIANDADELKPDELQGLKDDMDILRILRSAPVQTLQWKAPVHLKTEVNPLKSRNVALTVNGIKASWLLDTGANLSVVSKSLANQLGLTPLPGEAQGQAGTTGIENKVRVAVLPTLVIGGATLHHVVLVIMDDASLKVGPKDQPYQIRAILGYPVLRALGWISFSKTGYIDGGPSNHPSGPGAPMYMDALTPVLQCSVYGRSLPFYLDTGASGTNLFPAYASLFHKSATDWTTQQSHIFGAGGTVSRQIFVQPKLTMRVGDKEVVLRNVKFYSSQADSPNDFIYGNLGQDFLGTYETYTLDFDAMIFVLNPHSISVSD